MCLCFVTRPVNRVRSCQNLAQPPSRRTTPRRLSPTAYSIYSQLPSILEVVSLSATWGRVMPCWQGPTSQDIYIYIYIYIYMLYHNGILFQIVAVSVVVRLSDAPCHNHDRLRIFLIARNTSTNIVQVLKVKVQTNKCRLYTVCIVSCYRFT